MQSIVTHTNTNTNTDTDTNTDTHVHSNNLARPTCLRLDRTDRQACG